MRDPDTRAGEPRERRRRRGFVERHRIALIAVFVCLACAITLFPGPPSWRNKILWAEPGPGLYFKSIAQALSEGPIVSLTGEFSVEIFLKPGFRPGVRNQEILSFYDDQKTRPLLIGQFPGGFILRGRADNPTGDARHDAYIGIDEVGLARPNHLQHLAVNVGESGARLYVNGRPTELMLPKTVARLDEPFGGHLMLGTSNTGWPTWFGTMLGVSVYDRALSDAELWDHAQRPAVLNEDRIIRDEHLLALYRFEEGKGTRTRSAVPSSPELYFPERLMRPTRPNFLTLHNFDPGYRAWLLRDISRNITFFLPLGVLIGWRRPKREIAIAVAAGLALSLGIEVAQSFVPGRTSSLVDVASNALGAGLGAWATRLRVLLLSLR